MSKEKYIVLDPDGYARTIEIDRLKMLEEFRAAIDADDLECVSTEIPDVSLIVDGCGKIKVPAKRHNEMASRLYAGYLMGQDNICGSAILAAIHYVDGAPDWVPLSDAELARVTVYLGRIRFRAGSQ